MPKYAQIVNMLFPPSSVRLEYGSSGLKVWLAHALVQRRARAVRGGGGCEGTGRTFGVDAIKCAN